MTEPIFILLGIAIGMPAQYFLALWLEERAFRRRSKLTLPGDRIITRMK